MSKQVKNLMVEELKNRYGELDSAAVVRVIGLDAVANNRLRAPAARQADRDPRGQELPGPRRPQGVPSSRWRPR